jgi:hypothetical protein
MKTEVNVDFIERLTGLSPDAGDGTTELLYVLALILIVCLAINVLRRRALRNKG